MIATHVDASRLQRNGRSHGQRGRSPSAIVSRGASLFGTPRRGERNGRELNPNRQILETLESVVGGAFVFHGLWRELTTGVQLALADWSLGGDGRSVAVVPVDLPSETPPLDISRWRAQPDIVLVQPTGNLLVRRGKVLPCTDLEAWELARDDRSPVALAITGHGAEYCVQFGSLWLSTDPDARLPGPIVDPRELRSPLVFLNSCASLRLGDSTVPMAHSLSATLYSRGSMIIGAFRNLHTSLEAPRLFAEGLLSGAPLGRVIRNINLAAVASGVVIPPYQAMADPTLKAQRQPARRVRMGMGAAGKDKDEVRAACGDIASAGRLAHTVTSWFQPSEDLQASHDRYKRTLRYVLPVGHGQVSQSLTAADIDDALRSGRDAVAALLASLLRDLRNRIQTVRWLETCYAPISLARVSRRCGSGPKTSLVLRHVYKPVERGMLAVTREDCCVRGTLREWIGARGAGKIKARLAGPAITVDAGPLAQHELGTFFIHRTAAMAPVAWPAAGGRVSFPVDELPFRGRVIVVAGRIGPGFVHFEYRTIFVPAAHGSGAPDAPDARAAEAR
ncbi:MAG: hypothetical protein WDM91_23820 [Rhizomicrobium sp.]